MRVLSRWWPRQWQSMQNLTQRRVNQLSLVKTKTRNDFWWRDEGGGTLNQRQSWHRSHRRRYEFNSLSHHLGPVQKHQTAFDPQIEKYISKPFHYLCSTLSNSISYLVSHNYSSNTVYIYSSVKLFLSDLITFTFLSKSGIDHHHKFPFINCSSWPEKDQCVLQSLLYFQITSHTSEISTFRSHLQSTSLLRLI